ncbi:MULTISPECIES: glycosyltransferase [unclassified Moorena]|uniref:glycosyltransferase n=1 Tax=unclassified Moorena TaxID=2683338 RepID=UPI001400EFF0|nr:MULTISPECIES: glycosyltransferase [unclassified Moorena]NEO10823.1 glycosyltransferase [Moorena sp. SIO3E8]NEP97486.1 glycosyltransferase [Moorena sp. SIO3F7]
MTHFGIICPPASSHLNLMTTLGYELKQRGHRVTVLGIEDAQPKVLAAGLEFEVIGKSDFPKGTTKDAFTQLGHLRGFKAFQYTINRMVNVAKIFLQDAPEVIKAAGIELLLVDQVSPEGGTIAEYLDIPFVTVCAAVILNREISVPPFITSWNYDPSWRGIIRNRVGYAPLDIMVGQSLKTVVNEYRKQWNLSTYNKPNQNYSKLAQLSQQPAEFEFPRRKLPSCFHFTGPYSNPASREAAPFPYEKLTEKPLIYASMGTLQNRLLWIFERIAKACVGLDAQLVITLGGAASPESLPELPGNPIVVSYAPQLELLQKATLTITHAGMNTTLESLSNGVPMVAIPIANDQPGVAARITWTGTGEVIPLGKVRVEKLQKAIKRLLTEDSYKKNALRLQEAIRRAGGVSRAADIIEQVVATGKPVISHITT